MGTACDRERDSVPKRELIAMVTYQKFSKVSSPVHLLCESQYMEYFFEIFYYPLDVSSLQLLIIETSIFASKN
jgi:hypothetical protein